MLLGQFSRSVGGRSQVTLSGRGNRKGELGNWWRIIVTEIQWMGARAQRIVQVPLRPRGRQGLNASVDKLVRDRGRMLRFFPMASVFLFTKVRG